MRVVKGREIVSLRPCFRFAAITPLEIEPIGQVPVRPV